MQLSREKLNIKDKESLNRILAKSPQELSDGEIQELNARASYLSPTEKSLFEDVLSTQENSCDDECTERESEAESKLSKIIEKKEGDIKKLTAENTQLKKENAKLKKNLNTVQDLKEEQEGIEEEDEEGISVDEYKESLMAMDYSDLKKLASKEGVSPKGKKVELVENLIAKALEE